MSNTEILIFSNRMKRRYRVNRFYEYAIDMDLDMDAHQFNMVFGNPNGVYTGVFNKYDDIWIYIGNIMVLRGTIDEPQYMWDNDSSVIRIVGRDIISVLIDNDALPATKYNVKPSTYIKQVCDKYGIVRTVIGSKMPVIKKLVIGCGESEISVINDIIGHTYKKIWSFSDGIYVGDWATNIKPRYYATRGLPPDKSGIPIKSLDIRDSGQDIIGEYIAYKSENDGKNKKVATFKNTKMINKKIFKRRTTAINDGDDDSGIKEDHNKSAKHHVKETFRNSIELILELRTRDVPILFNNCIHVIDAVTKINSVFFIRGITYNKGFDGSNTILTCIPSDRTLNTLWNNYGTSKGYINGLPDMSIESLIANVK